MTQRRPDAETAVSGLFARPTATGGLAGRRPDPTPTSHAAGSTLRQGVELSEDDVDFLRSLSRPARTGQPRTLGSKFVATGVLAAAIEILRDAGIDMDGVAAGDAVEMKGRAFSALRRAGGEARP
jgi:hypothetical protein